MSLDFHYNKRVLDDVAVVPSKRIKEQINCITFTTGGLLICTGKIESPEKKNIVGEIDLFI